MKNKAPLFFVFAAVLCLLAQGVFAQNVIDSSPSAGNSGFWDSIVASLHKNFIVEDRYQMILEGLQVTLTITVFATILGTILGGLICWMRLSKLKILRRSAVIYVEVVEGVPVLVLLLLMFYVFLSPFNASGVLVAIITFAINTSAYISEIFRSAIENINYGQTEAGLALGHTPRQTFFRIILRQVVKRALPVYQGEVVALLKETSIVGYIAVIDLARTCDIVRSRTYEAFFPLIVSAVVYFVVAWVISFIIKNLAIKHYWRSGITAVLLAFFCVFSFSGSNDATQDSSSVTKKIRTIEDMQNATMVVQLGTEAEFAADDIFSNTKMLRVMTTPDAFTAVVSGRADFGIEDKAVILNAMQSGIPVDTMSFSDETYGLCALFEKTNTALQKKFNDFIKHIKKNGELDSLINKWLLGEDPSKHPIPTQKSTRLRGTPIRIATEAAYPPYNLIVNGKPSGFEVELGMMFGDVIGRPIVIDVIDYDALIPYLSAKKGDIVLAGIGQTEERAQQILFSEPYYDQFEMAFIRKDSNELPVYAESGKTGNLWTVVLVLGALFVGLGIFVAVRLRLSRKEPPRFEKDSSKALISVSHLQKKYGDLLVQKDLNLEVHKGDIISIIGPSGTGKSTFLRCLNLLEKPTSGDIFIQGVNILSPDANVPMIRQKMGMVFQSFNLFEGMTILDNITISPIKLLGKSRNEAETEARKLLNMVGLGEKANSKPEDLSGGQKQRVAIARALAMHPEILLFDEPTSALDPTMVSEVLEVMTRLAREGITMLIVTHEMRFARLVSTRVCYFDEGIVYEEGTPEQIFEHPQREKTRKFIHQIHESTFQINSEQFDWYAMMAQMKSFCERFNCSRAHIEAVEHAIEEALTIVKPVSGMKVSLEHSEKDGFSRISIASTGKIDPKILEFDKNQLSVNMLKKYCQNIQFTEDSSTLSMTVE